MRTVRRALAPFSGLDAGLILGAWDSLGRLSENYLEDKHKEYDEWLKTYNSQGRFNAHEKVGLKFLKYLRTGTKTVAEQRAKVAVEAENESMQFVANDESGLVTTKSEGGAPDDDLFPKLHRELFNFFKDNKADKEIRRFACSGHEYLRISTMKTATVEQKECFVDKKITNDWFRKLMEWLEQIECGEDDQPQLESDHRVNIDSDTHPTAAATDAEPLVDSVPEQPADAGTSAIASEAEQEAGTQVVDETKDEAKDYKNTADEKKQEEKQKNTQIEDKKKVRESKGDDDKLEKFALLKIRDLLINLETNSGKTEVSESESESEFESEFESDSESEGTEEAFVQSIETAETTEPTGGRQTEEQPASGKDLPQNEADNDTGPMENLEEHSAVSKVQPKLEPPAVLHEASWRLAQAILLGTISSKTWIEMLEDMQGEVDGKAEDGEQKTEETGGKIVESDTIETEV